MAKSIWIPSQDRRNYPRNSVMWSGSLTSETEFDMYILDCRISNFSIAGVHVLVERALANDRPVTLKISGVGEFTGRVAWSKGNEIGVEFDDAPDRIAALTKDKV